MFLFEPPVKKNRRLTPSEMETELQICKIFKRNPRTYFNDLPFYPYVPQVPKYSVNFDLNPPQ